ncbi:hypothetical protein SKAU_G00243040 [Synaphobranchus kaupii]|uniref:PSI domain-containing protein n=1 Tax=Synaphobranchus kaupii TaxID=118154 RepID=A0A9Q1F821_SYNKA|nr:hypothetical protein SKAU_G00243040 [Synaphobranchus kaupii]
MIWVTSRSLEPNSARSRLPGIESPPPRTERIQRPHDSHGEESGVFPRLCLDARDPYCGWDRKQRRCTTIEDSSNMSLWTQNITVCPLRNLTVDGGFGPWATWQPCSHDDGDSTSACVCRSRSCDSPLPRCGGQSCEGPIIEVSNCSRNGGWTPWSSWGQCSTSCGIGFEVRQRSCNNPSPRHGGRICVGQSREERLCNEKLSCPLPIFWSSWGSWTKCSAECGGGVHSRVRSCENGNSCPGCALEYKACNLEACPEVRRNTPWTPWMPVNVTQGGARQEQRVRYTCRAQLPDPHELQFGKRKVETRFCPNDGSSACETDTLVEDLLKTGRPMVRAAGIGWSSWETWSACSQDCAKGFRTRKRTCATPEGKSAPAACTGSAVEYQDCNPQPCPVKGAWSCWSSWSQCSVTCGGGHYQRTRSCNSPAPADGGDICIGLHTEEALCNTHPCEGGWTAWSDWSPCDDGGLQTRSRTCEDPEGGSGPSPGPNPCQGNGTEHRDCLLEEIPADEKNASRTLISGGRATRCGAALAGIRANGLFSSSFVVILPASGFDKDRHCGGFTLIHLIATGVSCFFGAGLLTFLAYAYCQRFHKPSQESAVIHPTTPNHLNYKGNTTPKNENYTPMEFKVRLWSLPITWGPCVCGDLPRPQLCNEKLSCPLPIFWSSWGSWTKCSAECGGGVHSRVRSCENGNSCPGCALEYKACNLEACPEVRRNTPWTPWMPVNVTQGGARQEQRFGKRKVETRFCPNDGSSACETDTLVEDLLKTGRPMVRAAGIGWSSWETWSACSQDCAKGFRTRKRTCATPEGKSASAACTGSAVEYQDCNPQPCPVKGAWSCWSSWSQCSVTCGGGHYQRTRSCNSPAPADGGDICIGLHTEEALCNTHPCEGGWTAWSDWSPCDDGGLQTRSRTCEDPEGGSGPSPGPNPCQGNGTEHRDCLLEEIPVILPASGFDKDRHCGGFTLIHLIATGVSCFFGAGLLTFLAYAYCQRFHKPSQESAVIHPTTPNHLNYKGNTTPKNENYTPMEFKTLNKNNLLPDERTNFFHSPLQQTNVYTTTYYPATLNKYDYRPDSSPSPCRTYTHS